MRAERPSATACVIAASLGVCSADARRTCLVNPLAATASPWFMKAYGMPASLFSAALLSGWCRSLVYGIEHATIPGILLHYLVRKRCLEQAARDALSEGIRQVVILGAGFDVLATTLHREFPHVTFFEVDFPATQAAKRKAFENKGLLKENLLFIPVDFMRQKLSDVLSSHPRYRRSENTLFLAEGVLMYLSQQEVDRLFEYIRTDSGPDSRFVFTFMEPRSDGGVNFHNRSKLVDLWMKFRGEPFTWGLPRAKMPDYLKSAGFVQTALATPEEFRQHMTGALSREVLAEGEYVCVARRAGGDA